MRACVAGHGRLTSMLSLLRTWLKVEVLDDNRGERRRDAHSMNCGTVSQLDASGVGTYDESGESC